MVKQGFLIVLVVTVIFYALPSLASQEVGSFVQLRGSATIERPDAGTLTAKVKTQVELKDIVATARNSRAKMLFLDESMLTLGPDSKANIEKFIYSLDGGGASIFNLLEGTMRAVVGKTQFEVHTPTTVAAARGTVIEFTVGYKDGVPYTIITCLEGVVEVKSTDPNFPGTISLKAGETITVFGGMPLPEPQPAVEGEPGSTIVDVDDIIVTPAAEILPPIDQGPSGTTPVTVDLGF